MTKTPAVFDFDAIQATNSAEPATETEIQALWRESDRLCAEAYEIECRDDTEASWEAGQAVYRRAGDMDDKIIDLPAVTVEDALVHAKILAYYVPGGSTHDTLRKLHANLLAFLSQQVGREVPHGGSETAV